MPWSSVVSWNARGQFEEAEQYLTRALVLNEALGRKVGVAASLGNLGLVYRQQGALDKAAEYYHRALEVSEALGFKVGVAASLGNLGRVHWGRGEVLAAVTKWAHAAWIYLEVGVPFWQRWRELLH